MSEDWVKELRKVKEETEEKILESHTGEEQLREKYKEDKEKIIDLIYFQLKPVEETFRENQPKIERRESFVSFQLPIEHEQTHTSLGMSFFLQLTDTGYGAKVYRDIFDHVKDNVFQIEHFIAPPVNIEKIRKEIREFLDDRKFAIQMLEEKRKRHMREFG